MLEDSLEDVKQLGKLPITTIRDGVFYIRQYRMKRMLDATFSGRGTNLATHSLEPKMYFSAVVHRGNQLRSCPCPRLHHLPTEMLSKKGFALPFCYLKRDINWRP